MISRELLQNYIQDVGSTNEEVDECSDSRYTNGFYQRKVNKRQSLLLMNT